MKEEEFIKDVAKTITHSLTIMFFFGVFVGFIMFPIVDFLLK